MKDFFINFQICNNIRNAYFIIDIAGDRFGKVVAKHSSPLNRFYRLRKRRFKGISEPKAFIQMRTQYTYYFTAETELKRIRTTKIRIYENGIMPFQLHGTIADLSRIRADFYFNFVAIWEIKLKLTQHLV